MTPRVFLVILCLGVASAAVIPNPSLDAELQEQKDKEELKRIVWDEFIVKLHNSENDQDNDYDIEMSASGQMTDEEYMKIMTNILHPMFGEEQTQPGGDVLDLRIWQSGDEIPVQDQPE
ncbi:trophoblast-specific protein alpha-like [Apodemus sylvaticus]|uniref:trophoblast-specific protein alpha-like n=1 Tax=Apodemus sylvaticus TaxID=10129 RepID=UPI002243EED1|nr:trophoblast-specific protein alpha-like [Apodemus sylvaticus]